MKTPEEIKKGLFNCYLRLNGRKCKECPYILHDRSDCDFILVANALDCIEQLENHIGELTEKVEHLETRGWELFALLSSAWYGKDCYFKQDDGTVYSRASCQYLSFDQATDEFATALTNAHEVE